MNSIEKVHLALEEIADMDDGDLDEALPIPIPLPIARGFMPLIARNIPDSAEELDAFLTQVGNFCHSLRSDEVIAHG